VGGSLREAAEAFKRGAGINNVSDNYQKQVKTAINCLAEGLGWDAQVQTVARQDIIDFREDGLEVRSPSTVRSYMLVLRRLFAFLLDDGWIRRNPTRKVALPKATGREDLLWPEQVGPFLDCCWELLSPYDAAFFSLLALGGLRKGAGINQRREHVDLEARWTDVVPFPGDGVAAPWSPKTEASIRAVPLHPVVAKGLSRLEPVTFPDGSPSPWLFPVTDGRKQRRYSDSRGRLQLVRGDRRSPETSYYGRKLREALKACGVEQDVTVHGLRRTLSAMLDDIGAPDRIIAQALGHAKQGTTQKHYLLRRDRNLQRWIDRIRVDVPALGMGPSQAKDTSIEVVDSGIAEQQDVDLSGAAPHQPHDGDYVGPN
jgi:integrase